MKTVTMFWDFGSAVSSQRQAAGDHVHGGRLKLQRNEGHLQGFELYCGDRPLVKDEEPECVARQSFVLATVSVTVSLGAKPAQAEGECFNCTQTVALLHTCFFCFQTCQTHLTVLPTRSRWLNVCHKTELRLTFFSSLLSSLSSLFSLHPLVSALLTPTPDTSVLCHVVSCLFGDGATLRRDSLSPQPPSHQESNLSFLVWLGSASDSVHLFSSRNEVHHNREGNLRAETPSNLSTAHSSSLQLRDAENCWKSMAPLLKKS